MSKVAQLEVIISKQDELITLLRIRLACFIAGNSRGHNELIGKILSVESELSALKSDREEKEDPCNRLFDYIVTEQSIQCDICGNEDHVFDIDLESACDHFYGNGWRIIDGTKYCLRCVENHNKNQ